MTITNGHALIGLAIMLIIFVFCEAANAWMNARGIPDSTRVVNDKNRFREYNRKRTLSSR
jgi:hypothetical protein